MSGEAEREMGVEIWVNLDVQRGTQVLSEGTGTKRAGGDRDHSDEMHLVPGKHFSLSRNDG